MDRMILEYLHLEDKTVRNKVKVESLEKKIDVLSNQIESILKVLKYKHKKVSEKDKDDEFLKKFRASQLI